ncbi:MAG TPA: ATP-binding cassette domain-containing protein [Acidimicrobiia bacterium]
MRTSSDPALDAAAAPGRASLRRAAGAQVLETVGTIVQWAALAWIAQTLLGDGAKPTWPQLALLLGGGLVAAGAGWRAARLQAVGSRQISRALRGRIVGALLPRARRRDDPDAATAALATVELVDDVAGYHARVLPQRLSAPASMALVFLVAAAVEWPAAALLALATLLLPLNMRLVGLVAQEGAEARMMASERLSGVVLDSFRGMSTLQNIGALRRRREELVGAAARLNITTMAIVRRAFLSGAVMDVVITFSIAANATYIGMSLLGYVAVPGAPTVTLGRGLFVLLLCPLYFQPMRAMAAAYHARERAAAGMATISALVAAADDDDDLHGAPMPSTVEPVAVVLDAVAFRFPGSSEPMIEHTSITAQPGRWTAVAGPSGAGKTTLLSLIAGAREPTAGTVVWLTPSEVAPPALGSCAWIGQHTVILPGSIRENIRLGRSEVDNADIARAVTAAGLTDVVARLPLGLETQLGEGAWGLSTGEARRVAIARAFLSPADLWVLDEPTAHLDATSEARVIDALRTATYGRTVVVATHSAAIAGIADTLWTIRDGTVRAVREAALT